MDPSPSRYQLKGGLEEVIGLADDNLENRVEQKWFSASVPRATLKTYMKRSDRDGWMNFGPWLVMLVVSGVGAAYLWGSWWAIPAFFVYGTLYSSSDARWHECGHGTAFRTRWVNDAFYHLSSFMTIREAYFWRWSHSRHHTDTYIVGRDMEIQVPRPANLWKIAADYFYVFGGSGEVKRTVKHALGIMRPEAVEFVPEGERWKMVLSSRIYVAILLATVALAIDLESFLPLLFIWTPRFYCGWHHQLVGVLQHAGLDENVRDHRLNTRTVYMNPVWRFLYLNMNYHLEHHMFPMIPFYALPKFHEVVKDQLPPPYPSCWAAYCEMIPALVKQSRDGVTFIKRPLPAASSVAA